MVESVTLATRHAGGGGPVVTWLHGYTMDARIWPEVWSLLPGYRHVGIDLPGHGASPPLPSSATLDDWAVAVEQVMETNGSRLLVALCMGTMVAAQVVLRRRVPLDGTVLIAPALVGMEEDLATANRFGSLAVRAWRGAGPAELAEIWMREPSAVFAGLTAFPARLAALRSIVADHAWPNLADGGPMAFRGEPQTVASVADAAGPLLVVSGGRDMRPQRATALALARHVSGAVVVDLPELGHLPILEDPAAVAPAVGEFLAARTRSDLRLA